MRGDGLAHWLWLTIMIAFALDHTGSFYKTACWIWVFVVVGMLPTHDLMSASHGGKPQRNDSWTWDWMQNIALWIAGTNYKLFGVIYGILKGSLLIVACVLLAKWSLLVFTGLGLIYYIYGIVYPKKDTVLAELTIGAILGYLL